MSTVHKETSGAVQAGDIVVRKPVTLTEPGSKSHPPMHGRVVYVHPLGRFHMVEFYEGGQAVRECFAGVQT